MKMSNRRRFNHPIYHPPLIVAIMQEDPEDETESSRRSSFRLIQLCVITKEPNFTIRCLPEDTLKKTLSFFALFISLNCPILPSWRAVCFMAFTDCPFFPGNNASRPVSRWHNICDRETFLSRCSLYAVAERLKRLKIFDVLGRVWGLFMSGKLRHNIIKIMMDPHNGLHNGRDHGIQGFILLLRERKKKD